MRRRVGANASHLDALHLRYPFYGARRLRDALLDEEVYLHAYESLIQARNGLEKYFKFYNTKRKHQTLKARPN
ncbi:MAG: transposase [Methylococcales bacterium]|nr:transposase [Methylococcales bacterium]